MKLAFGVVGAILVLALGAQLLHGDDRLSGSNFVSPAQYGVETKGQDLVCQAGETLFEGTDRLRLKIGTNGRPGPPLELTVTTPDGERLNTGGLDGGWKEGVVRIPLDEPVETTRPGVNICIVSGLRDSLLAFAGEPRDPSETAAVAGVPTGLRISVRSLRPGSPSLLASTGKILERYGKGNARWSGRAVFLLSIVLFAGAIAAAVVALRRPERALKACALAGLLVGVTWAIVTPPFHVPDENSHLGYVATLVETGKLPKKNADPAKVPLSAEEQEVLAALDFFRVIGDRDDKPPWTDVQEDRLRAVEDAGLSRRARDADTATNNPPLYYLLQAPVYAATSGGTSLTAILPMRLVSALLGAVTVLFCFLFLRELLPRSPWTWTAGALAVAFQPLFGFITGGVNADALLFAMAAGTFYFIAAILRSGLTMRRAIGLGAVVAAGILSKPLFGGLVPAAALAVLIGAWRLGVPFKRRIAVVAAAGAVALVPVLGYHVVGTAVYDHGYFQSGTSVGVLAGETVSTTGFQPTWTNRLSYAWQFFLPRLPGQSDQFAGSFPLRDRWFAGFVGRFGWLDYAFPRTLRDVLVWPALALLVAAFVAFAQRFRERWLELVVLLLGIAGVCAIIGVQNYSVDLQGLPGFSQPRYILPLLALYGLLIAAAVRLTGRRAGPVVAVGVVGLAVLHTASALILTVGRYYA